MLYNVKDWKMRGDLRSYSLFVKWRDFMARLVETVSAEFTELTRSLLEEHSVRLYSRGAHFSKNEMIPVYFILICGKGEMSEDVYANFLFNLKNDIKSSHKPFAFIDEEITVPPQDLALLNTIDTSSRGSSISGLCSLADVNGNAELSLIAQNALGDMLSGIQADVVSVAGLLPLKLRFISRAIGVDGKNIPLIMYYGNPSAADTLFLCYAVRCGFDVVCISPDEGALDIFEKCPFSDKLQKEVLGNFGRIVPFPTAPVKVKIATSAYKAERELDTLLYSGDTMFRSMQFSRMTSAVLQTTADEVEIYWDQDAMYRPGFRVDDDVVTVPVIFSKFCGIPEGKVKEYWANVEDMLTPRSLYMVKSVAYKNLGLSVARSYKPFHAGKKLDIRGILNSSLNKYTFLSASLQSLIFEKAQAVIDDGMLLMQDENELVCYVMYVALNLSKPILNLLQQYDFTKEVPKIIVADTIEDPFSKLECTQLLLLSYLGFDILIYSPSGYRNIETYVSEEAFSSHTIGEYMYNQRAPQFRIPSTTRAQRKQGFFRNLFKKGK